MSEKMLAAVFRGEGRLVLEEVPVPQVTAPDDVLLEVEAASICGTDVHIVAVPPGYIATPNTILGHEYVGKVLETGPAVTHLKPGDRAVVNPNVFCGHCAYCRAHLPNVCENIVAIGIDADGGFARYSKVPASALHKVAPALPADLAVFTEPLACVVNGTQAVRIQPGETAVVLGAGPIGLLFTQMFKAAGARVIVSEPSAFRRGYAELSGADVLVDPTRDDLKEVVRKETRLGADVVVDVVGTLFPQVIDLARKGGTGLVFGVNAKAKQEVRQFQITTKSLRILGTWLANATFPPAVRILESGVLTNLERLITHRMPLAEIHKGIGLLGKGEAVEVIVYP